MPKVSIIVLIRNVESHLRQFHNQTFRDWECLLFSDGSKDASSGILHDFAAEYDHFKIIENQQRGYDVTCNRGLE